LGGARADRWAEGLGRPVPAEGEIPENDGGESITRWRPGTGVGEVHSSVEAGESPWSEGTSLQSCLQQSEEGRLSRKDNTTGVQPPGFTPERGMDEKVSLLRWKLGQKAKREPEFRFHALHDRVYRRDVLMEAYRKVGKLKKAPGVDGVRFEDVESDPGGPEELVEKLHLELRRKQYRPLPVLRAWLEKPDGRRRPLGIPCVRDRVAQAAVLLVLEPIFEADFLDCSHGYRPGRRPQQAVDEVRRNLLEGRQAVYDADLSSYFDNIPHGPLMEKLERRIADRSLLTLIRMWLDNPVREEDGQDRRPGKGTPQGGVVSPLPANIHLHEFDRDFHEDPEGPRRRANARLVRFADDMVVMARYMGRDMVRWIEGKLEGELGLPINRNKTRVARMDQPGETLDFLGFTLRLDRDLKGRSRRYWNLFPSAKATARLRDKVRAKTRSGYKKPLAVAVDEVNIILRGWKNYFNHGYPRKTFRGVNHFVRGRFSCFLANRSQRRSKPFRKGETAYAGLKRYGLLYL